MNRVFITLFVYRNGGSKVYYPNEIKPIQDGVKTNSAHYLVKLVTDDADLNGPVLYTLVVSIEALVRRVQLKDLSAGISVREKRGHLLFTARILDM